MDDKSMTLIMRSAFVKDRARIKKV